MRSVVVLAVAMAGYTGEVYAQRGPNFIERLRREMMRQQQQQQRPAPNRGPLGAIWQDSKRIEDDAQRQAEEIASRDIDDTLFLPGKQEELDEYLTALNRLDDSARRACTDRLDAASRQRQQRYGYRPMPAAEQMQLAEEGKKAYADCDKNNAKVASALRQMEAALGAWTASLPASADSMVRINKAYFQYGFDLDRSGPASRQASSTAKALLERRRSEIDATARPAIVQQINLSGGTQLIDDMTSTDGNLRQIYSAYFVIPEFASQVGVRPDGKPPFYRTATSKWTSSREDQAQIANWTEPTGEEIGFALLRTFRDFGGTPLSPFAVTMPNVGNRFGMRALDGLVPLSFQLHDVRKEACRRASGGYQCSYRVFKRAILPDSFARDPVAVMLYKMLNTGNGGVASALFVPRRGGWGMPELENQINQTHANQLDGLTKFVGAAVDAGGNAINVMQDAVSPRGNGKSQMEAEHDERIREADEKARRGD